MSAVANLKEELDAAITEEFLAPEGIGCCNHGRIVAPVCPPDARCDYDDHGHVAIKEGRFRGEKKGPQTAETSRKRWFC